MTQPYSSADLNPQADKSVPEKVSPKNSHPAVSHRLPDSAEYQLQPLFDVSLLALEEYAFIRAQSLPRSFDSAPNKPVAFCSPLQTVLVYKKMLYILFLAD